MCKKTMYIYKDTHMPKYGWFQGCYVCNLITSNVEEYNNIINTRVLYKVYICRSCQKKKNNHQELKDVFNSHVREYILMSPS